MENKRVLALILGIVLSISLVGCASDSDGNSNTVDNDTNITINTNRAPINNNHVLLPKQEEPSEPTVSDRPVVEYVSEWIEGGVVDKNYVLNENTKKTIEDAFLADEIEYAIEIIGQKVPTFSWTLSTGEKKSNDDFGDDKYILEFFSPECGYCHEMAAVVDSMREAYPEIPVISLSQKSGDFSDFNELGENAFLLEAGHPDFDNFMNCLPWIPAFVFVEDDTVQYVTYGYADESAMRQNYDMIFEK